MPRSEGMFVRLSPDAKAWIDDTAAQSGLQKHQVIERLVANARDDPAAYYAHASATQSWVAAVLLIAVVRRLFTPEEGDLIRQHVEDLAMSRFAADPPAPTGVEAPVAADQALRRLLDNLVAEGR